LYLKGDGMSEPQLLTIDRAAVMAGMNERTFRRRIAAGEMPTLISPIDRRRKLIRLDDLRRYMGEVPIKHAS
jgi:sugar lactone lactonase YvrE